MSPGNKSPEQTAPQPSAGAKSAMTVLSFLALGVAILVVWVVGE
jgi:hypothetical protein